MKQIFKITVENCPGVLYRLVSVFYKRKINISSVHADETNNKLVSRVEISAEITTEMAEKIKKQINKIIEVIEIK